MAKARMIAVLEDEDEEGIVEAIAEAIAPALEPDPQEDIDTLDQLLPGYGPA